MSQALSDLPEDVRRLIAPHAANTPATLDAIGDAIASKRDEAKSRRKASGIEETWRDAEEAYVGMDDANRHEFNDSRWSKPVSIDGPVTTGRIPRGTDHKSTAYVRLTSRYVDAGAAKLGEILLPADDKAFSFSETPVPDLIKEKYNTKQVVHNGVPLTRPAAPGEAPPAPAAGQAAPEAPMVPPGAGDLISAAALPTASPSGGGVPSGPHNTGLPFGSTAPPAPPPQVPVTVKDFALENIEMARKKAKAAETRIYDWMVECRYQAEMRKVIHDAARIGVGVLKAPVPVSRKAMAVEKRGNGIEIIIRETIAPAACWVAPWSIFPDPACGENISDGDYIFECDHLSARQVRGLKDLPGYIGSQIDKVLEEGPDKSYKDNDTKPEPERLKDRYSVWYFYGSIKQEEMAAIDSASGRNSSDTTDKDQVYAIVTLINNSVVRATINPLDSGKFPYHSVPWQRRAGHWAGVGVAEQVRMPQRTINAATRAMLNNAGNSAGAQIVVDRGAVDPANGEWLVTPDKFWYKKPDAGGNDVRQAFTIFEIPNMTDPLMKIIEYALQLAEESTSIPLITQGQTGPDSPETLGATNIQNSNANQLLRSIGYVFDDYITEPVVRQFYEWLLLDPEVPDEEKGEFTINAHGSVALVERAIQDQTIQQILNVAKDPAWGIDPKKAAKSFLKSKRLDPEEFLYTEEEQAKIDAAPPPEAPAVAAARINSDTQLKLGVMKQTADQQTAQSEERIAAAANALEGGRMQINQQQLHVDATVRLHELEQQKQLALIEYANANKISLDAAKVQLAKTAMQLQTERDLNAQNQAAGERKHRREMQVRQQRPPVQAPGRAANGHAFDQTPA